jgi:hypothetical protein
VQQYNYCIKCSERITDIPKNVTGSLPSTINAVDYTTKAYLMDGKVAFLYKQAFGILHQIRFFGFRSFLPDKAI